jgi:hypothetical protein
MYRGYNQVGRTTNYQLLFQMLEEHLHFLESELQEVRLIRSMENWRDYARNADSQDHPLRRLRPEEVREFTDSLVFRNGGLASANVGILQERLTYREYQSVLAEFGMDLALSQDYQGYRCANGTCVEDSGYLCTDKC